AEQGGTLGRPVARRAGAVLLAGQDDQRDARLLVRDRGVEDGRLLAGQVVDREPALDTRYELVAQPDVRERTPDHHLVVPAPGPVRVEVRPGHAVPGQVLAGRRVGLDGPGRRDVVRGDRVAELGEHPGAGDVGHRPGLGGHALEIRRLAYVR